MHELENNNSVLIRAFVALLLAEVLRRNWLVYKFTVFNFFGIFTFKVISVPFLFTFKG